ncbi:MAG: hypothetical protein GC134_05330 [Proteobacteria bacterium]|nr:hypothetical protein [Pseudomonadota bacterium]
MAAEFKRQLDLIRSNMADMLAGRRGFMPPQLPTPYAMPYPDFSLHPTVNRLLANLGDAVKADIDRYAATARIKRLPVKGQENAQPAQNQRELPPALQDPSKLSPDEQIIVNVGSDEEIAALAAAKETAQRMADKNAKPADEDAQKPEKIIDPAKTGLGLLFDDASITSPFLNVPKDIDLDPSVTAAMSDPMLRLYCLLFQEVEEATMHMAAWNIPMPSMQRIKKSLQSLAQDKIGDAILILRNGRKDDPNNKLMAFTLSQLLYFRCQEGHNEYLPEAREEAKKSCSFDERYPQEKLTFFRYHHVASEMSFDKGRAQELLREYYLLNSDALVGEEGLRVHQWHHLKALVLLSRLPVEFWSTYEIECVHAVTEQSIGGALIYLKFFRPLVLQKLATESAEYARFHDIEHAIRLVYIRLRAALEGLNSHFKPDGTAMDPPAHTWTVASRYLRTFLQNSPLPTFENLLANTSLDGRRHAPASKVEEKLHNAGLHDVSYWTAWLMKTSHDPILYNDGAIPDRIVFRENNLLKQFDGLLGALKAWEEPFTSDEKWEKARIYLAPLPHDKLLELGTGQPLGALAFGSGDAIYKNYYKGWASLLEDEILASENIQKRANAGVFWSVEEIMATFDGAQRIMEDPMVGLQARVRAGYRKFVQNRGKSSGASTGKGWQDMGNESFSDHFKQYWWLYAILLPMAIMTFIVIVSARSYENAIRMIVVVIVFAIVGFLIFSQLIKRPDGSSAPPSKHIKDHEGQD